MAESGFKPDFSDYKIGFLKNIPDPLYQTQPTSVLERSLSQSFQEWGDKCASKKKFRETFKGLLAGFSSARRIHCVDELPSIRAPRNATSKSVPRLGCMFSVLITAK